MHYSFRSMEEEAETKFDYFDVSTVRLFAESHGFNELLISDDALECLTSDLNYRLREIAHVRSRGFCSQEM